MDETIESGEPKEEKSANADRFNPCGEILVHWHIHGVYMFRDLNNVTLGEQLFYDGF